MKTHSVLPASDAESNCPSHYSRQSLQRFHSGLQLWYKKHGRHSLPWRNTTDPYAIYVSEIMLQQTQVKTVLEKYYFPFLRQFPTLAALAKAKEGAVLKAWEGLGYYSRALNLHKAAKLSKGIMPARVEELMALPGIGRNTAHAVAAFAFRTPAPVMEANVRRVLHRIFALKKASEAELWEKASALLDKHNPFDYNQAMMDLGAMVCSKRNPRCGECPAFAICAGKSSPESYSPPKQKKQTPARIKTIVVFSDGREKYFMQQRKTKFLNGLYGFMEYDGNPRFVRFQNCKHPLAKATLLGSITQSYSHFTLKAKVYVVTVKRVKSGHWKNTEEIQQMALSRADTKVVELL